VVNPVLRSLLMSPAPRVASVPLTVLRFTGGKSGHDYRIVVGCYELDGCRVVFTAAGWRLKFRGTAPLWVAARGRWREGTGTLVEDPEVVAAALQRLLDGGASPAELGLRVARGRRITADDVRASGRAMIRLELDGSPPPPG
jgi:hypothetical protein